MCVNIAREKNNYLGLNQKMKSFISCYLQSFNKIHKNNDVSKIYVDLLI